MHGVDADARAFLLTRPYLKRAVKVDGARTRPTGRRTGWSPPGTRGELAAALAEHPAAGRQPF